MVVSLLLQALAPQEVLAANGSWSQTAFTGSGDGTYTNTQATEVNGSVGLAETKLTNDGGGSWNYRKKITINNTPNPSELTDYQIPVDSEKDLVAHYNFDEGSGTIINDSGWKGRPGTLTGSPTWTTSGRYGNALNFDGVNDISTTTDSDDYTFTDGSLSVETWFKASAQTGAGDNRHYLVAKGASSAWEYGLYIARTTGGLGFESWTPAGAACGTAQKTDYNYMDGNWHHVVGVRTGNNPATDYMKIYVDGIQGTDTLVTCNMANTTSNLALGMRSDLTSYYKGQLDEVKIHDRALSPTEALANMQTNRSAEFNKMQFDGDDIRFTDSDGKTELPHWTENFNNVAAGKKNYKSWVKTNIPALSSKDIYMYYGNGSATSSSSGADTFLCYRSGVTSGACPNDLQNNTGFIIETAINVTAIANEGPEILFNFTGNGSERTNIDLVNSTNQFRRWEYTSGGGVLNMQAATITYPIGSTKNWKISVINNSFSFYFDGQLKLQNTNLTYSHGTVSFAGQGVGDAWTYTSFMIRKYASVEPLVFESGGLALMPYKKDIAFNTTATGANIATPQNDFPVAVHINSSSMSNATERAHFFGSHNTAGKRVQFWESDESMALDYEVEYYDQASQEAIYWVRVPKVDGNSSADKIKIGYGRDSGATQDNGTGVWLNGYAMVQHLGDNAWGTAPEAKDSAINANNGTNTGTTETTGVARKSRSFNGSSNIINMGNGASLNSLNRVTIEAWVYFTGTPSVYQVILIKGVAGSSQTYRLLRDTNNTIQLASESGGVGYGATSPPVSINTWHHVAGVYNGSIWEIYVDGVGTNGNGSGVALPSSSDPLIFGRFGSASANYFSGQIDEARISTTDFSADRSKLSYYSTAKTAYNGDTGVSAPFVSYGAEAAGNYTAKGYAASGTFTTVALPSTSAHQGKVYNWKELSFTQNENGQTIYYDILNSATGNPVPGYERIEDVVSPYDISGINPAINPGLKVRATLESNGTATPTVSDLGITYGYDVTAPTISSFSINANAQYTNSRNVTLALTATDTESGVTEMQFSNDGQAWSAYEPYATSKSWTLSAGDGTKQVLVHVKDAVGNVASYTTASSVSPVADWQAMTQGNHYGNFYDNVTGQWATVTRAGAKTIYDPDTQKIYDVPANYLGVNPRKADLVNNGTFASDSDWTKGVGWTISGGAARFTATGAYSNLTQNILYLGDTYRVTLDVTVTSGTLYVKAGSTSPQFLSISSSGSYTIDSTTTGTTELTIQANTAFTGTVDNVTARNLKGPGGSEALIEEARTNGFLQSTFADQAALNTWSLFGSLAPSLGSSPSLYSGVKEVTLVGSSDSDVGLIYRSVAATGESRTSSWYIRRLDGANVTSADCEIVGNNAVVPSTFTNLPGTTWYRVTGTYVSNNGNNTNGLRVKRNKTVVVAAAQDEAGSFATSYIPTVAGAVTRNADAVRIPTTNWSANMGTFVHVAGAYNGTAAAPIDWALDTNNRVYYYAYNSGSTERARVSSGGISYDSSSTVTAGQHARTMTWSAGSPVKVYVDGLLGTPSGNSVAPVGTMPVTAALGGTQAGGSVNYNGPISRLLTYTSALSSTDVTTVTNAVKDGVGSIILDSSAPVISSFSVNSNAQFTNSANVSLALSANDGDGTPESQLQMQFSNDGQTWSTYEPYVTSKSWTLSAGDGTKQVLVHVKDAVGNVASYTTASSVSPVADWQAMTQGNHYGNFYDNVTGQWATVTRAGAKTIYDPDTQKIYDVPANYLGVNPRSDDKGGSEALIEEARTNYLTNSYGAANSSGLWTSWSAGYTQTGVISKTLATGSYGNTAQRLQYTGVAGDSAGKSVRFTSPLTGVGSFLPGEDAVASIYINAVSLSGVTNPLLTISAHDSSGAWIGTTSVTADARGFYTKKYANLPPSTSQIRMDWRCDGVHEGDTIDITFSAVQVEKGAFASSYIPTTTTAITRAAEVVTIPTTGWSATAGTMTAIAKSTDPLSTSNSLLDTGYSSGAINRLVLYTPSSNTRIQMYASGTDGSGRDGVYPMTKAVHAAFAGTWTTTSLKAYFNGTGGTATTTDATTVLSGTATIGSFYNQTAGSFWNAPISRAVMYNAALSDADNTSISTKTLSSAGNINLETSAPNVSSSALISPNGAEKWKGGSGQTITWNPSAITDDGAGFGATPIKLEYSTNGTDYTQIATGEANDGTYTWNPVSSISSTTVKIRITATDQAGNTGTDVSDGNFTIDSVAPTVPTGLNIGTVTSSSVPLSWTASADAAAGIAGYEIYRAPDSAGSPGTWVVTNGTCSGVVTGVSCTDTGLSTNTKYYYRVRAKDNVANYSSYSGEMNVDANVKGLWHLDEGTGTPTVDSSGNGNNGTMSGANYWTNGKLDKGFFGNGVVSSNSVILTENPLDMGSGDFTIEAWVKTTLSGAWTAVYAKGSGGTIGYALWIDPNGYPDLGIQTVSNRHVRSNVVVNDGNWHFVAVVANRSEGRADFYVDGQLRNNTDTFINGQGGSLDNTLTARIGRAASGTSAFFEGSIDEVRVSNVARTAQEIADYYAESNLQPRPATTLTNVPTAPTATAASASSINPISWTAPAGGVNHYHVYSSSDGYASPIYNSTGTSISQSALSANTQYTYRVYGVNADGAESATYAEVSKYTLTNAPTSPSAAAVSTSQIDISWTAPTGGVNHYHIYSSSDGYASPIYNSTGTSTSQSGLSANTQYTYRVYGVNADNIQSPIYAGEPTVVVIQPLTSALGYDNQMYKTSPTNNYGSSTAMFIGELNDRVDGVTRALIRFDLAGSLPAGINITSAELSLYAASENSDSASTFRVYRSKRAWSETASNWNNYNTGMAWETPGGFGANDTEQTEIGSREFTASETLNQWKNFTLNSAAVNEMYNGSFANNGFYIKSDLELNDAYYFNSSDNLVNGPKLTVVYGAPIGCYTLLDAPVLDAMPFANTAKPAFTNTDNPDINLAGQTIRLHVDGNHEVSTVANGSGVFTFSEANYDAAAYTVPEGIHLFKTDALNDNGEPSEYSNEVTTNVDFTSPTALDPAPEAWDASDKGRTFASGAWGNLDELYFEWSASTDFPLINPSGLKRYHVYFGADDNAIPKDDGTPTTGTETNATRAISSPVDGVSYYVRIQAEDNAGNYSTPVTIFTYLYDGTAPTNPTTVIPTPAGWSETNSYDFAWTNWAEADSAIAYYLYARKETSSGETYEGLDSVNRKVDDNTNPINLNDVEALYSGTNWVRIYAVDIAGNISDSYALAPYFYSGTVPGPANLTADPAFNDTNSFSFGWTKPVGITPKGYYCGISTPLSAENTTFIDLVAPPATVTMKVGNKSITNVPLSVSGDDVNLGPFAAALAQGQNTFYCATRDENDNIGWSVPNPTSASFTINTTPPAVPANITVSDSSKRGDNPIWALTVAWNEIENPNDDFFGYEVWRCTAGCDQEANFNDKRGTVTTNIFSEAGLDNTTDYYYRIKSIDNVDSASAFSDSVHRIPTGNYTEPPAYTSDPIASADAKALTATIDWNTDRVSTSKVLYAIGSDPACPGTGPGSDELVTDHTVELTGLTPGTTYKYRIQSLDEDRDYAGGDGDACSDVLTFETLAAPGISDVQVASVGLDNAILTWKTTSSATSKVLYGETAAYGKTYTDSSSSSVTTHTVRLTALDDSTDYNFKIQGTDVDGNTLVSDNYVFETLTFPIISNLVVKQVPNTATSTVRVTFDTNVPTTSQVVVTGSGGKEVAAYGFTKSHAVTITGLLDNTAYTISAHGRDRYGNEARSLSEPYKTDFDTRPPLLNNITSETENTGFGVDAKGQLVVSWETDEPSTSQVEYGIGSAGGYTNKTQEDTTLTTSHVVVISDLKTSSPYHFRVISKDRSDNKGTSDEYSALTPQANRSVFDAILNALNNAIGWMFR